MRGEAPLIVPASYEDGATVDQAPEIPGVPSWPAPPPSQSFPPPPPPPVYAFDTRTARTGSRMGTWDKVTMGLGIGAVYIGIGALLLSGFGLLLIKVPVTSVHGGLRGTVDRSIGKIVLDIIGMFLAVAGASTGGLGAVLGGLGLITRRAANALLSILGVAVCAGALALGIYALSSIGR